MGPSRSNESLSLAYVLKPAGPRPARARMSRMAHGEIRSDVEHLAAAGHRAIGRTIVKDDAEQVRDTIGRQLANPEVQVIITTGGTGITSRDNTFEAVSGLLWKRLDGFGELFRMLSYEQIGAAAMLSRAIAGLIAGRVVVSLPGSEAAVRLALEKLLIPELGHLVRE